MEVLAIALAIIIICIVGYRRISNRENELAKRLEDEHDPNVAASLVDFARMQDQEDANFFRRFQMAVWGLRWWW